MKLYKPNSIGERAWARGDLGSVDVQVTVPPADKLGDATAAVYYNRTWNGLDNVREPGETHYRRLNGWDDPGEYGGNHRYSFDVRNVPPTFCNRARTPFSFYSQTVLHHGMEILYPGPGLSVEYTGAYASPTPLTPALSARLQRRDRAGDVRHDPVEEDDRRKFLSPASCERCRILDAGV